MIYKKNAPLFLAYLSWGGFGIASVLLFVGAPLLALGGALLAIEPPPWTFWIPLILFMAAVVGIVIYWKFEQKMRAMKFGFLLAVIALVIVFVVPTPDFLFRGR